MATSTSKRKQRECFTIYLSYSHILLLCHLFLSFVSATSYVFKPSDISQIVENSCFVGISRHKLQTLVAEGKGSLIEKLSTTFQKDPAVVVGEIDLDKFTWSSGKSLKFTNEIEEDVGLFVALKKVVDRTCLSVKEKQFVDPKVEAYAGIFELDILVAFVNEKCGTFRVPTGSLSVEGLHRQEILRTLFFVKNVSTHTMNKILETDDRAHFCDHHHSNSNALPCFTTNNSRTEHLKQYYPFKKHAESKVLQCEKVPFPSREQFFHDYVKVSKPVIFTGAIENWTAFQKWTNDYLRERYGDRKIHIKLTPSGEYEGVDYATNFENFKDFKVPSTVSEQLLFPDLVIVRPAAANMVFADFLDLIETVSNGSRSDISGYLEYSSISDIASELEEDVEELNFAKGLLNLAHRNIWLSDGNTVGKLHFDPFDNLLCQISGKKQVLLFDPHDNRKLYEAHIPEANLHYDRQKRVFSKKTLVDSTSMVMSPVDMTYPNLERFPLFGDTYPMNCTIDEGEVLFMPAFWWHEVLSSPNMEQGRNLAVNFWYDPFLTREFPCQECQLDINQKYRHLL